MPDTGMTRRRALTCGCGLAFAGSIAGCSSEPAMGPEKPIASLSELDVNIPIQFTYPDEEVAFLIDVGKKLEGGVGPNESIVAYSGLCQHMGTPVEYKADREQFVGADDDVKHGLDDPANAHACGEASPQGLEHEFIDIDNPV